MRGGLGLPNADQVNGLYLGLDASTQSLTGVVIEVAGEHHQVLLRRSLSYDATFPQYGTTNGVLPGSDPLVAVSSPLLWAEALDRFFAMLAEEPGLDLARLRAVSGAAQQHGSVYLNADARAGLDELDPDRPLADQVASLLSRAVSPIWMDASTGAECAAITDALGGAEAVTRLTGSRAVERFTGPQIRKFAGSDPAAYEATDRIHLVSSYLASLLIGSHSPLEPGDASGMNLMELRHARWAERALRATAPELSRRLPPIVSPSSVIGFLAPYWMVRYRLPAAAVVVWTGDNPSSLVGTGLVEPGRTGISLGTSDTVFRLLEGPRMPVDGSHVFGAPTGGFMALTCFQNGGLARDQVRQAYGLDWEGFAAALRDTPPGNDGRTMLPWFRSEITPRVHAPRVWRIGLDEVDAAGNVRAVIEAQMMSMARHSAWMGGRVRAIHTTGGAAATTEILQVMADVFDAEVHRVEEGDAAALGSALRAWHGSLCCGGAIPLAPSPPRSPAITWAEVVAGLLDSQHTVVRPGADRVAVYAKLLKVHARNEAQALREMSRGQGAGAPATGATPGHVRSKPGQPLKER